MFLRGSSNFPKLAVCRRSAIEAYLGLRIERSFRVRHGLDHGKHLAETVLCTDTFVQQNGTWKMVADHCSVAEGKGTEENLERCSSDVNAIRTYLDRRFCLD
jgi:hypothetical protein